MRLTILILVTQELQMLLRILRVLRLGCVKYGCRREDSGRVRCVVSGEEVVKDHRG